jgi:hypothetical protein
LLKINSEALSFLFWQKRLGQRFQDRNAGVSSIDAAIQFESPKCIFIINGRKKITALSNFSFKEL